VESSLRPVGRRKSQKPWELAYDPFCPSVCQVVEQHIPHSFIKRDFIGCIDIIAFNSTEVIGVQR
jgi:hypothetical protein